MDRIDRIRPHYISSKEFTAIMAELKRIEEHLTTRLSGNSQLFGRIVVAIEELEMKLKGTAVKGITIKDGKVKKIDKAPPHVKMSRRRKAGKVIGAKPAKR